MADKIIDFQQRRRLEQAFADLGQTQNELELAEAAKQIAHEFPAATVLPALLRHLDTADSQTRGGLGHLAALLPQEEMLDALRGVAADRRRSPLARMTAAAIAQRYLGVEFPAGLTGDLNSADDAAFQSLLEAIDGGKHNRHILLEYVEQMRELSEEIAYLVIEALGRTPPADQVELLRLIAQDQRAPIARATLAALEMLAATEAAPLAVRALHTLQFVLPAELAAVAERSVRKLRMAGRRYEPPEPTGWHSLLSPADPNGNQTVWLVHTPAEARQNGVLLGFTVNLEAGVVRFFGSETVESSVLPAVQEPGQLLTVNDDSGGQTTVLAAPFDYGRWLVAEAIKVHLAATPPQTLPGELQLYNDLIWQFTPPQLPADFQPFWQIDPGAATVDPEGLETATAALFAHPVMGHWRLPGRAIIQATPAAERPDPTWPPAEIVGALLREIDRWPESAALGPALQRGLQGQAAWLHLAGEEGLAQHAHALAEAMPHLSILQNPVLAQMLAHSLQRQPPDAQP
jgi:hypothetical protein